MKNKKSHLVLIVLTLMFLILLLFIQVKQLIETADTEKRHFAQSVKLSLNLVAEQMSHDRMMCKNLQFCLLDTHSVQTQELKRLEWHRVDSIIRYNLEQYKINLAYDFEIINTNPNHSLPVQDTCDACFSESLEIALPQAGIELMVRFPEKNMFIIKRIGPMFISSIMLIFLLLVSFILILGLYLREKILAERIKNFVNNMVHEFKTPLASIGFANHRLQSNNEMILPAKMIKYTEIIDNEKNKLEDQISHILELAQLESEFRQMQLLTIDLKDVLQEAIKSVSHSLTEKNGSTDFQSLALKTKITGSKTHLINAFSNVLDNACKYSDENLKIAVNIQNEDKFVKVEIADNGFGIARKYQKYIFDKFYRVPTGNLHNIKGYGIGLSYVKEVIKMHHGKIELHSAEGKGSRFIFFIPFNDQFPDSTD